MHKRTIKDINLRGKTVLLRADYNVPVRSDGMITDDYRIKQSVPTIQYLLEHDAAIIICSHLGRPKGPKDTAASLWPVAKRLHSMFNRKIEFVTDCVGPQATAAAKAVKPGQIVLLENLRYHPEEEQDDDAFAKTLAGYADIFVQDGFGVVHRAHASTHAITKHIPSVTGLLLEKEYDAITAVVNNPKRPLMAVIGGAKIADKIEVLERFIQIADVLVVGGAMANTFLRAEGIRTGKSLTDEDDIPLAKRILASARAEAKKRKFVFYLPQDGVVATSLESTAKTRIVDWDAHVIASVESYPKIPARSASTVGADELILDAGPFSGAFIAGSMQLANTVVWNGALGVTETKALHGPVGPFAHGTELLVESMLGAYGNRPFTLVGGGDTVGYIESRKLTDHFNHVSTGGGASLELMSGKKLPGIEALQNKI